MNNRKFYTLAVALMSVAVPEAFASAIVSVAPVSSAPIGVGQTFTAAVSVSGIADLFSFQFDLSYSPKLFAATSVTEGPFLASGGSTFFIPGTIDNTAGTVSFTADSLLGSGSGVSGSGVLADIIFRAVGGGSSPLSLSNAEFLDSTLSPIVISTADGTSPQVVPEPGSWFLLVCGVGVLGLLQKHADEFSALLQEDFLYIRKRAWLVALDINGSN